MSTASAQAWIRVARNDVALFNLALDAGTKEVVVPMVTTKVEGELAVAAATYPPEGMRGWGPFRPQYQGQPNVLGRSDYFWREHDHRCLDGSAR